MIINSARFQVYPQPIFFFFFFLSYLKKAFMQIGKCLRDPIVMHSRRLESNYAITSEDRLQKIELNLGLSLGDQFRVDKSRPWREQYRCVSRRLGNSRIIIYFSSMPGLFLWTDERKILEPIFPLFLGRPVAECTHTYNMIIHIHNKGGKKYKNIICSQITLKKKKR
jgi:hypothetical protein